MLAHACANALTISGLIDLFVKSISCLAEVFIYRKIDLFLREFPPPPNIHSWRSLSGVHRKHTVPRTRDAAVRCRVSPLGDRVLRQSSLTRSPRPTFTLTDELFITVEESTGDPANFSMGLLAVLKLGRPIRRRAPTGRFEISLSVLLNIFMKWTRAAIHAVRKASQ